MPPDPPKDVDPIDTTAAGSDMIDGGTNASDLGADEFSDPPRTDGSPSSQTAETVARETRDTDATQTTAGTDARTSDRATGILAQPQ